MSNGMKKVWIKSERKIISSKDYKGNVAVRTGKNGGPVIEQKVNLVLTPKEQG